MNKNRNFRFFTGVLLTLLILLGIGATYKQLVGPTSTTDNAIVRWDGTGGFKTKDSSVLIDNNGLLTANDINVNTNTTTGTLGVTGSATVGGDLTVTGLTDSATNQADVFEIGAAVITNTISAGGAITGPSVVGTNSGTFGTLTATTNAVLAGAAISYTLASAPTAATTTNWVVAFCGGTNTVGGIRVSMTNDVCLSSSTNAAANTLRTKTFAFWNDSGGTLNISWNTNWHYPHDISMPLYVTNDYVSRITVESWGLLETNVIMSGFTSAIADE